MATVTSGSDDVNQLDYSVWKALQELRIKLKLHRVVLTTIKHRIAGC